MVARGAYAPLLLRIFALRVIARIRQVHRLGPGVKPSVLCAILLIDVVADPQRIRAVGPPEIVAIRDLVFRNPGEPHKGRELVIRITVMGNISDGILLRTRRFKGTR